MRLELEFDEPLSTSAFKFSLCRYILQLLIRNKIINVQAGSYTRPLLSST